MSDEQQQDKQQDTGGAVPSTHLTFEPPVLPAQGDAEARKAYLKALCAFQAEALSLPKGKSGHNYKYTDLASALSTLRPLLAKHGLVLTFRPWTVRWGLVAVMAVLEHVDGYYQTTQLISRVTDAGQGGRLGMAMSQAQGAVQTYMCRYAMMGILGLTAAVDTDGAEE